MDLIEWEQHDGGKRFSKRPKQKMDCTVRALAIATATDYDQAYDFLKSKGRSANARFAFSTITKQVIFNHVFVWAEFKPSISFIVFTNSYTHGTFILQMNGHVACVKDSVLYDSYKSKDEEQILGYWRIEKARTAKRKKPFKPFQG